MELRKARFGAPVDKLYFAAIPPPEVVAGLFRAWSAVGTRDHFRRGKLHLSILGIGPWSLFAPLADRMVCGIPVLQSAAFDLVFDHLAIFGAREGRPPIVSACTGASDGATSAAREIHTRLGLYRASFGKPSVVTPHVTLAYGDGFDGLRPFPHPVHWRVSRIHLVHNHVGLDATLESLACWPLAGRAGAGTAPGRQYQLALAP